MAPSRPRKKLMTVLTTPWSHSRDRMVPAALAASDGQPPEVVRGVEVTRGAEVPGRGGKPVEMHFRAPRRAARPGGRPGAQGPAGDPAGDRLHLRHALAAQRPAIDAGRLLNRHREELPPSGQVMTSGAGDLFNVCYAADFDASDHIHPTP